jgi:hypothetical protein
MGCAPVEHVEALLVYVFGPFRPSSSCSVNIASHLRFPLTGNWRAFSRLMQHETEKSAVLHIGLGRPSSPLRQVSTNDVPCTACLTRTRLLQQAYLPEGRRVEDTTSEVDYVAISQSGSNSCKWFQSAVRKMKQDGVHVRAKPLSHCVLSRQVLGPVACFDACVLRWHSKLTALFCTMACYSPDCE